MKQLNDEILKSTNEMWADRPVVFGDGDKNAIIMLIGEAPGAEEVKEGRPFVGKAGKNLNEFLEILGLKRENLYISNVVKVDLLKIVQKQVSLLIDHQTERNWNFLYHISREKLSLLNLNLLLL